MSEQDTAMETTPRSGFIHLHNHTDFSLLDGAAQIPSYIARCKECGMDALAITDHGNMYGALKFYKACKAAGIKPIIGSEFYMNPRILLAMNDNGYHHLMELTTLANTEGFYYKPRIDDEILASHSDDLICLSACLGGEILQNLLNDQWETAKERAAWFKSVFGDRYYLELQDHGLEEQKRTNPMLVRLSKELDIPLVCTNDIHYISREDANAQDTLLCIGTNARKSDEKRMRFPNDNFYFKSEEEMRNLFSWCPQAIENTRHEGCIRRYGEITEALQKRLDHELEIILKMKFDGYFLIVRDYIYWAKTHDIPVGPGRPTASTSRTSTRSSTTCCSSDS